MSLTVNNVGIISLRWCVREGAAKAERAGKSISAEIAEERGYAEKKLPQSATGEARS
jgi:hypothetical protein